jgi:hypothetical protein
VSRGPSAAASGPPPIAFLESVVELEIPARRPFHAAGRLVAGGVAARVGLDVDRMEDLRLAVEALLFMQSPAGETLTLTMAESGQAFDLEIGPFVAPDDSDGETDVPSTSLPSTSLLSLEPVVRALVDDFVVHEEQRGVWFAVRVTRRPDGRGSR